MNQYVAACFRLELAEGGGRSAGKSLQHIERQHAAATFLPP